MPLGYRIENHLNPVLVNRKEVSDENVEDLNALHSVLMTLKEHHMARVVCGLNTDEILAVVTRIEYQMQDLWGFGRMQSKHTHRPRMERLAEEYVSGSAGDTISESRFAQ